MEELVDKIKAKHVKGGAIHFDIDPKLSKTEQIAINLPKVELSLNKDKGELFTQKHSFIDFRYLILGEKLRSDFTDIIEFDDYYMSSIIHNVQQDQFFDQSSVRKIIDF